MEDEESTEENDRQEGGGESPFSSFFEETLAFPCNQAIKTIDPFTWTVKIDSGSDITLSDLYNG